MARRSWWQMWRQLCRISVSVRAASQPKRPSPMSKCSSRLPQAAAASHVQRLMRPVVVFLYASCLIVPAKGSDGSATELASLDGGSDCQAGVNVTFYELDEVQAQHLAGQFPFKHGRGELLDALKGSETWVVPNVNFGPPEVTEMGGIQRTLEAWPRQSMPNSHGLIARFVTKIAISRAGFYTFYIVSESPVEFDLSHSGNGLKAIGSGAKLEGNDTALYGFEEYLRFSLAKSMYDITIEWHRGLPNAPKSQPMLILEYGFVAEAGSVPSPSLPKSPRMVVPPDVLFQVCDEVPEYPRKLKPVSVDATVENVLHTAKPRPTDADSNETRARLQPYNGINIATVSQSVIDSGNAQACNATYSIMGPWTRDQVYHIVVIFGITAPHELYPPYKIRIEAPNYTMLRAPFNLEIAEGSSEDGVYEGRVTESWATLNSHSPVKAGATFVCQTLDFRPHSFAVNGNKCSLVEK